MQDSSDRFADKDVLADVVLHETEALMAHQMGNVLHASRKKVVEANDMVPQIQEPVTEMTAQEPRTASDHDPHERLRKSMKPMLWRPGNQEHTPRVSQTEAGTYWGLPRASAL
jgi:hypothetical protein